MKPMTLEQKISKLNALLWSVAVTLTFFWILNIAKESFGDVKKFLDFYKPVGPLLGLFFWSLLVFLVAFFALSLVRLASQKLAFWLLVISAVAFLLMVFPPFFHPFVSLFSPK